jgi:cbb3-type cytochrome oxidase cytochrome c subunit
MGTKIKLKLGEKLMFGFAVLLAIAAVGKGIKQMRAHDPAKPRDYYEWTQAGLDGHYVYRSMGCHNCHRAMGVGEIGHAPVLDGVGARRTQDWLERYFRDPGTLVPATAHDGHLGPDFRKLSNEQRAGLVAFLYGLKANPGSPNYPVPPGELDKPRNGD